MKIGRLSSFLISGFICIGGLINCNQIEATVENVKDNQPTLRGKEEINSSESKVSVKTLSQDSSSNSSSSSNSTAVTEVNNPDHPCNLTYSDLDGVINLTDADKVCEIDIHTSSNGSVLLSISGTSNINEGAEFTISSFWNDDYATLYSYFGGELDTINSLDSISPNVHIFLNLDNTTGESFAVTISYKFQSRDSIITTLLNSSGTIDSTTNQSENGTINYQYIWLIEAGDDNVVYFFLRNVTLNDAAGDFVAIGTGNEVLGMAPSLVFTGHWTSYSDIIVNGTEAYVYLFMKTYTNDYGIIFDYQTSLYVPPTVIPPSTKPPPAILNATIKFHDNNDKYYNVTTDFVKYITKYAELYCGNEAQELDVVVTEIVETKPCLEIIFYIDILNGTCVGSAVFTVNDYKSMMGNFSQEIEEEFGRSVMTSCPYNMTPWIVGCVIIILISLMITIFVQICTIFDFDDQPESAEIPVTPSHEPRRTSTYPNIYFQPTAENELMSEYPDLGHTNRGYQDDDDGNSPHFNINGRFGDYRITTANRGMTEYTGSLAEVFNPYNQFTDEHEYMQPEDIGDTRC